MRLARSVPGFDDLVPQEGSTILDDIQVNQWNFEMNSIFARHISPNSIDTSHLTVGLSFPVTIEDGSVTSRKLATGAVTADKVAAFAIDTENLVAGAVTGEKIQGYTITSNKLLINDLASISTLFSGSITISSQSGGGAPNTGIYLTSNLFQMIYGGIAKVSFNTATNTYSIEGDLYAKKFICEANTLNDVNFGNSIVIGGDIMMYQNYGTNTIYFSAGIGYIRYNNPLNRFELSAPTSVNVTAPVFHAVDIMCFDINASGIECSTLVVSTFQPTSLTVGGGSGSIQCGNIISSQAIYLSSASLPNVYFNSLGGYTSIGGALVTPVQNTAAGLSTGSVRISYGGSIWIVNASGNWDRIRTYTYNP